MQDDSERVHERKEAENHPAPNSANSAELDAQPAASLPAALDPLPALLHTYRRRLVRLLLYTYNAISTACLAFFITRAVSEYGYRSAAVFELRHGGCGVQGADAAASSAERAARAAGQAGVAAAATAVTRSWSC